MTRRTTLAGLAAAPALLTFGRAAALGMARLFTFGVASGEPTPDGMVLWTRLGAATAATRWFIESPPIYYHERTDRS